MSIMHYRSYCLIYEQYFAPRCRKIAKRDQSSLSMFMCISYWTLTSRQKKIGNEVRLARIR